jgi:hypothetical protein
MDTQASDEDRMLRILGAAVIDAWNDLPRDIQETLFERSAAIGQSGELDPGLRAQLALFLHKYNKRTAARPGD